MHALQPIAALPPSITTLDGSDLEYVDNYKYLGVWLDCKLSFKTHISNSKLNLESSSYFPTKPLSLMLPNIPSYIPLDVVYHSAIHFVTKAPCTTHHCDLYAPAGPRYIFVAKPTGSSLC